MTDPQKPDDTDQPDARPSLLQVIHSVVAAVFGVQSGKNRERDFKQGKASDYIMVYVILVIALVIGMVITVNVVLSNAGH